MVAVVAVAVAVAVVAVVAAVAAVAVAVVDAAAVAAGVEPGQWQTVCCPVDRRVPRCPHTRRPSRPRHDPGLEYRVYL